MKKTFLSVIALFLFGALTAQASSVSISLVYDTVANTVSQIVNASTASFRASSFNATSTSATSTFPNASSTNIKIMSLIDASSSKGVSGMVLQSDGSISKWVATSTLGISGGSGTPGGGNGQLQYNNGGAFAGTSSPVVGYITATTSATSTLPVLDITTRLRLATLTGLLKANGGTVSTASAGTDYVASVTGDWTGTFDGQEGTWYRDRANHTGTQLSSTISDLTTTIQALSVGTTSNGTTGNLAFWTGSRTLGNQPTTTLSANGGLSLSGTPIILGSTPLTITGTTYFASSTGYTIGGLAFGTGAGTLSTVATTTITAGTGITLSGTPVVIGASPFTISSPFNGTLATTSALTTGQLLYVTGASTTASIATTTLTFNGGLTTSGVPTVIGASPFTVTGTTFLASSTGYTTGGVAFATGNGTVSTVATGTLTTTATGLQLDNTRALIGGSAILSLTSGYVIPTSTLWTSVSDFYTTPSNRITAGSNCSWAGNTFNCTGGGGGSVSTTTDIVGFGPVAAVPYFLTDFQLGGSASTTSTIKFDKDLPQIILSSSTIGTTTLASADNTQSVQLGIGSTTNIDVTRSLHFNFGSSTNIVASAVGGSQDLSFNLPIRLLGAVKDSTGSAGTLGMVLQTTGTTTRWVATSTLGLGGSSGSSQWTTSVNDIYFATGKVGIGSTTPTATLSVEATSTGAHVTVGSSVKNMFTIVNQGSVGIGSSSPSATLSIVGLAASKLLSIVTSSNSEILSILTNGYALFAGAFDFITRGAQVYLAGGKTCVAYATSTCDKQGNATSTLLVDGFIDQGFWFQTQCISGINAFTQLTADNAAWCNGISFLEDANGVLDGNVGGVASGTSLRMRPGSAGSVITATGDGVGLMFTVSTARYLASTTPAFDVMIKRSTVQNSTSSVLLMGLTSVAGAAGDVASEPTEGAYFIATTTNANYMAACNPVSGGTTYVDTGVPSTTVTTGDELFPVRFKVTVATSSIPSAVVTYLEYQRATSSLTLAATCNQNLTASTQNWSTLASLGRTAIGQSDALDVLWYKVGFKKGF